MKKIIFYIQAAVLAIALFFCASAVSYAQTPGLIYKPATNGGNLVLDPNRDGYVSPTPYGFIGGDEGAGLSEIPYKPFPVFMDEPLSDLGTGAKGGHTDYAPRVYNGTTPVGSPLAAHFDGTNFLFRVRLGGQSTASKGYSILIDANNSVSGTGTNPGFEYEVVLCTNFDVKVYYHGTNTSAPGPIIFSGSVDQFSQKSVAFSRGNADPDYFYDFYVPASVFNRTPAINGSTPLRMTGVTVTSAKSGLFGVASDIGGVDDTKYTASFVNTLKDIINGTPQTTPTQIENTGFTPVYAQAPIINDPIYTNNTTISGYSAESEGTTITLYLNGSAIGTTTVNSSGVWTWNVTGVTLAAGNSITATASPAGKTTSSVSTPVNVRNVPVSNISCPEPPSVTALSSNTKEFNIQVSTAGRISIYQINSSNQTIYIGYYDVASAGPYTINMDAPSVLNIPIPPSKQFPTGTYYFTITPSNGGCTSESSNAVCTSSPASLDPPTITPTTITSRNATITITAQSGSKLKLYKNGVQLGSEVILGTSANTTSTVWTVSLTNLLNGDILQARATTNNTCATSSPLSSSTNVVLSTASPAISGAYCSTATAVSGTSSEQAGTTIILYNGNSNTRLGTTTVNTNGTWGIAGVNLNGVTGITATAQAIGKNESSRSIEISVGSAFTASPLTITSNPVIMEGATSLRGTAPAGSTVTLYINGDPYVHASGPNAGNRITALADPSNNWTLSGISPFDLYAGAQLTVTAKTESSTCESLPSAAVQVQCKLPNSDMTASLSASSALNTITICPGTRALIYLNSSEVGTVYNIYRNGSTDLFGPSVLGTGGPITLQSALITETGTILQVKTIKVGATCQQNIGGQLTVNLYPAVKNDFILTATNLTGCPGTESVITLQNATNIYSYQLINTVTKQNIGSLVIPNTAGPVNIVFPAIAVSVNTSYSVIITRLDGGCVAQNINSNSVTINRAGPVVNQSITASSTTICPGSSVSFTFPSENGYTYRLFEKGSSTALATLTANSTTSTLNTGSISTTGTKTYQIQVDVTNGCKSFLINEPVVNVSNGPAITVDAGPNRTVCGSTTTLQGSNPAPGSGQWTWVTKPAGALDPVFSSTTIADPTVSNLKSGTYVFRWSISTSCGSASVVYDDVTVTVNCAATYVVGSTKFFNEYVIGDTLAIISDVSDGGITNFTPISGIRPPGSNFFLEGNRVILRVTSAPLMGGTYTFTIRTTDGRGVTSDSPMIVRMYDRDQAPGGITPFPVELVYFKASVKQKQVLLTWETASEKDNDRFEVQRSADGKQFSTIATIKGNGNSSKLIKYSYTDSAPLQGTSYYRLKQIDLNGESSITRLESVKISGFKDSELHTVKAFPNPFSAELNVATFVAAKGNASFTILDMQGRTVYTNTLQLEPGENRHKIELPSSGRGLYILKVTGNGINQTTKLIKAE